ncbi:MAG TPA: hypothetical protein VLF67_00145 [Candidatus Saccharimonas sp.]|nr:hypothetical protein [Candidatus Saccharimonas sp.]
MVDIPAHAQQRHLRVADILAGNYGELFAITALEGGNDSELMQARCYLAMYYDEGEPEVVYLAMEPTDLKGEGAARRLQGYSLAPGEARGPFVQTLLTPSFEHSMELEQGLDDAALDIACRQVEALGLPVAIVMFCRKLSDGSDKVVYLYPEVSPPDRLLRIFKDQAARAFLGR